MSQVLDRTQAPQASSFRHIPLPTVEQIKLSNGIPVYFLPYGTAEVIEVQAICRGGSNFQARSGIAKFSMQNMVEASKHHSSLELAQELDAYGSWLGQQAEEECLALTLATISKNLKHTLHLFREVLTEPAFSPEEFNTLKARTLQKMHVSEQKTSTKASRSFRKQLFGGNHPYGLSFGSAELKSIELEELKAYYQSYISTANLKLLVTGQFDQDECLALLEKEFGSLKIAGSIPDEISLSEVSPEGGRYLTEQEGMQSSLRLGHLGMSRAHPDYYGMQVVNTILGGYFGSRLMHNIREEKGYTYGIYSGWLGLKHNGFFVVQADIGNEYVEATITEVKKEMHLLCDKGVGEEELQLVKNYMLGQGISQRETPFQLGDLLRFSLSMGISFEEIDRKFQVIDGISAEEVQRLAQTYLKPDSLSEIVVGKPE
ncbi:MAG: pitrilysin family protein [Bacteroidota bacterium]